MFLALRHVVALHSSLVVHPVVVHSTLRLLGGQRSRHQQGQSCHDKGAHRILRGCCDFSKHSRPT
jgi:hypothetical protein